MQGLVASYIGQHAPWFEHKWLWHGAVRSGAVTQSFGQIPALPLSHLGCRGIHAARTVERIQAVKLLVSVCV